MKKLIVISLFLIAGFSMRAQNYIVAIDYWFDNDYAHHINQSIFPQQRFNFNGIFPTTGISKGLHTFNIRFQQTNNFWSQTVSSFFYKPGESASQTLVDGYRYWVDRHDSVVLVNLISPVNPLDQTAILDLSWIPKGSNYLYMQFRDDKGNWSVTTVDSIYKSSIPTAAFDANDTIFCYNDSVYFIDNSVDGDTYLWNFGDGDSSNVAQPTHYYPNPGVYTVSLTVRDTSTGIDSTLILTDFVHISVGASASFSFTQNHLVFTFTNHSLNANSVLWDFGDGDTSSVYNPVHTYQHDGNYTIVLYAYDSCGYVTDTQSVSLVLSEAKIHSQPDFNVYSDNIGDVRIDFNSGTGKCDIEIIDALGRIYYKEHRKEIQAGNSESITLKNYHQGLYFVRIITESGTYSRRFFMSR